MRALVLFFIDKGNIMETNNGPVMKGKVISMDSEGKPAAIDWNVDKRDEEFSEDHLMGGAIISALYSIIMMSFLVAVFVILIK